MVFVIALVLDLRNSIEKNPKHELNREIYEDSLVFFAEMPVQVQPCLALIGADH